MSSKVEISKKLLFINSSSSFLTRILNLTIIVWLQQYLLKKISIEEYSLYPVIMSVVTFVYMLRTFLASGIARYTTEAYAKGDEKRIIQITSSMFLIQLCAGLLVLSCGLLFTWHIDKILNIEEGLIWDAKFMMGVSIFSFVLQLLFAPFVVGLFVKQEFVLLNIIDFSTNLLRVIFLLFLLFRISTRIIWLVVASEASELCSLLTRFIISRRLIPFLRFVPKKINWKTMKELLTFQSWTFLSQVAYRIYTSLDPIILNKLATPFDITCFHLGSLFKRQIDTTTQIITQPIVPSLTAMHAMDQKTRLKNTYIRYGRYNIWFFMFIALPLIIFRKELFTLYVGSQYLLAGKVVALLLIGSFLHLGNALIYSIALAKADMKNYSVYVTLIQALNLVITLFLVGVLKMGALGSAFGSFFTGILGTTFLLIPLGFRLANVKFAEWLKETLIPGYLPGMGASIIWFGLTTLDKADSWIKLMLYSTIGCIFYLFILLKFCLQENDRDDLKKIYLEFRKKIHAIA